MNRDLVKLVLRSEDGDEAHVETPWAKRVGPNLYELDNLPWFAYGISCGDIVEALPAEDGLLEFTKVIRKSGNRTVRVILEPPANESVESRSVLDHLRAFGCDYEGANHSYFAVNIPPTVDLQEVCEYLTASGHEWENADPSTSAPPPPRTTGSAGS